MTQIASYRCDGCKKVIGEKIHISLLVQGSPANGVAIPPGHKLNEGGLHYDEENVHWYVNRAIKGQLYHFHNGDCAKKFFDNILKEVQKVK